MRARYGLCVGLALGLAAPQGAGALTESFRTLGAGSVDGTALGDLDGDGRDEVVVLTRGGTYAPGITTPGIGGVTALSSGGTVLWTVQTGAELAGAPTTGDFDGDGLDEVVFCELARAGLCHLVDGDGTLLTSAGPFFYPGMAASAPTALDLDGDGADDYVVAAWGGTLAAISGRTGLTLWQVETYPLYGELFFGHSAVAHVAGTTAIVLSGYATGTLYAFDAASGTLLWSVPGTAAIDGTRTFGSGPAVADLDGDGSDEILLAQVGPTPQVTCYDGSGTLRWRTALPGADLSWMSPLVADVDPSTAGPEVLVQSAGGVLYRLDAGGAVTGSTSIGLSAWSTPSVVDADLDGWPELVTGNPTSVVLLDGATLTEKGRFDDPAGGLYPAPVVSDLDRNGAVDLVTSSWWSHEVVGLTLPVPGLIGWRALAGSARHTGRAASGAGAAAGAPPVAIVDVVQTLLNQIAADPAVPAGTVSASLKQVGKAFKDLVKGDKPADIVGHLNKAIGTLPASIPGYDAGFIAGLMAQAALASLQGFIDRATAIMGASDPAVAQARARLADARAALAAGDPQGAIAIARQASKDLEKKLKYRGDFCPVTSADPSLPWLCRLQQARAEVLALPGAATDRALRDARTSLEKAMEKLAAGKVKDTLKESRKAVESLVATPGSAAAQSDIALSMQHLTRGLIDDAIRYGIPAADAAAAEAEYAAGVAALGAGDFLAAARHFEKAAKIARP